MRWEGRKRWPFISRPIFSGGAGLGVEATKTTVVVAPVASGAWTAGSAAEAMGTASSAALTMTARLDLMVPPGVRIDDGILADPSASGCTTPGEADALSGLSAGRRSERLLQIGGER
jgi:hypothetical protein